MSDVPREAGVPAHTRILRSAAALFCAQGYAVTTMRDIASAVGLSKAGLYHHYSRKEDLLSAIAATGTSALMAQLRSAQKGGSDPVERLHDFVCSRMVTIAEYQDMLTVIWQERPMIDKETFTRIAEELENYRAGSAELIEATRKTGALRADVDPHLLMLAIDGMTGWSYLWMRPGQRYSPAEVGEQFWKFIWAGARASGASPS